MTKSIRATLLLSLFCLNCFAKPKIIIDTDSAYFNDDLFAIAQVIQSDLYDIVGITVTSGNIHKEQGASYVRSLLEILNVKIDVYVGRSSPIEKLIPEFKKKQMLNRDHDNVSYMGYFTHLKPPYKVPKVSPHLNYRLPNSKNSDIEASDFIKKYLRKNSDVTILALGPLTNISNALKNNETLIKNIKELVIMGGAINVTGNSTVHAETNFWFDPQAASNVFRLGIKNIVLIPLDITNLAVLNKLSYDLLKNGDEKLRQLFVQQAGASYPFSFPQLEKFPKRVHYFWDQVASSYLTMPDLFKGVEEYYIDVNPNIGPYQGKSIGYKKSLVTNKMLQRGWLDSYSLVKVPTGFNQRLFLKELNKVLKLK